MVTVRWACPECEKAGWVEVRPLDNPDETLRWMIQVVGPAIAHAHGVTSLFCEQDAFLAFVPLSSGAQREALA